MKRTNYPYQNFSLSDIKGERWKDIPGLEDVYQLSSYGRIKAVRRWVKRPGTGNGYWMEERIVKATYRKGLTKGGLEKNTALRRIVSYKGRSYSVTVPRMVYYLFVKKFNLEKKTLAVICRDGDGFNICPENLLLTSLSAVIKNVYDKGRRPRASHGQNSIPVSQYDLDGNFLESFASFTLAENKTGVAMGSISYALRSKGRYGGGFMWLLGESGKRKITVPASIKAHKKRGVLYTGIVSQYAMTGKKIKEYKSIYQAAKLTGLRVHSIRLVIDGARFIAGECHWIKGKGPAVIKVPARVKRNHELALLKKQRVTVYDKKGRFVKTYSSIQEVSRKRGFLLYKILAVLNDASATHKGYYWRTGKAAARIIPKK